MIKILPLSKKYLRQSSEIADTVFSDEAMPPSLAFEASLDKEKFSEFVRKKDPEILTLEYFVAVDEKDMVSGTSGLYSRRSDEGDSYWLGWFCVASNHRGKGIGKLLLDFCIMEARRRGKKFLKLYTSTNPNEARAQEIYENLGFYIANQKRISQGEYEIFFREKIL